MSESQLSLHGDLNQFFKSTLDDVLRTHSRPPSEAIQAYLVGVLVDSAKMDQTVARTWEEPLPVLLHSALGAAPIERFEKLRSLGDNVLLVSGFFHEHLERIGVQERYVEHVGARAYRAASSLLATPEPLAQGSDVLLELAQGFGAFAQLLRDVAATLFAHAAHGPSHLVALCEQFLRGGSEHIARLLRARGVNLSGSQLPLN